MNEHTIPFYDAIIAGAGPVGLFLACELRLGGCSVLLLEQADDPRSPLKQAPFGLRGLSVPVIEAFARRGLLGDVTARMAGRATPERLERQRRSGGHFAGIPFFHDQIEGGRWHHRLPGPISNVGADMASIEAVLTVRAETLGVEILRGRLVEAVRQSAEDVDVVAGHVTYRGRWLVGCDGGRSVVRKATGIAFTGTDPEFTGYSVEAELDDRTLLKAGRNSTPEGMYVFTPPGTIGMADFDGGAFHRSSPITREHVQAVLRRISGTDVGVTDLVHATTWTDRAHQAVTYRKDRVLLAGDAAHIHSPLGGQGLNLGLGDALNLGWKLAATIRGDAPDGLLDSYHDERHPIGARVLDWSRAQVVLMRPGRSERALESIIRDLIATRDGSTYVAERVWGVSLRHGTGAGHSLVGHGIPDFEWGDGTRVMRLMQDGKGLLLDFGSTPSIETLAKRWSGRVTYVAGEVRESLGLRAVLVRPDGVVAWASATAPDEASLTQSVSRWFGMG